MHCSALNDSNVRHDMIRNMLARFARKAMWCPIVEPIHLFEGTNKRPADVYIPTYDDGKAACIDVSIVSPVKTSILDAGYSSVDNRLAAADDAQKRKILYYKDLMPRINATLKPFVLETFGGCGTSANFILDKVVRDAVSWTMGVRHWR